MRDPLRANLRQLRLSGLAESLDVRIQEAQASRLSHLEFLELILQDELAVRGQRQLDRRTKLALFRDLKPLDQFDWDFNTSLPRKQIFELATCQFLHQGKDVLLVGPPGTGKTHIAQAIGDVPSASAILDRFLHRADREYRAAQCAPGYGLTPHRPPIDCSRGGHKLGSPPHIQ